MGRKAVDDDEDDEDDDAMPPSRDIDVHLKVCGH